MHYVRLLRPPSLSGAKGQYSLKLVLTITTDLGDSFLHYDEPLNLAVLLERKKCDVPGGVESVILAGASVPGQRIPTWKAGMRVLKLEIPLQQRFVSAGSKPEEAWRILLAPSDRKRSVLTASDVVDGLQGRILPVYVDLPPLGRDVSHVCFRTLELGAEKDAVPVIELEEDMGESIARHVWDAGLATLSMLADLCLGPSEGREHPMAVTRQILLREKPVKILELGSGVGTLGLGLATILRACRKGPSREITLLQTDLPEARERALSNIRRYYALEVVSGSEGSRVAVEFENLDWEDGRIGSFSPRVRSQGWDLVILSDCTYNTDTLPVLVQTLSSLHTSSVLHSHAARVFVATKQRHSSERAFFELMSAERWRIVESSVLPLAVLDDESQSAEVYLFERG